MGDPTVDDFDPDFDDGDCWNCGGEGFVSDCIDDCCLDADAGCDLCTQRCDVCGPRRSAPPQSKFLNLRHILSEDRSMQTRKNLCQVVGHFVSDCPATSGNTGLDDRHSFLQVDSQNVIGIDIDSTVRNGPFGADEGHEALLSGSSCTECACVDVRANQTYGKQKSTIISSTKDHISGDMGATRTSFATTEGSADE